MSPHAIPITVGVIGHRDIPVSQQDSVLEAIRSVVLAYRECFPESGVVVLTSLAQGADQLAIEACRGMGGVRILAALPMPEDEYLLDFTTADARDAPDSGALEARQLRYALYFISWIFRCWMHSE